MAIDIRPPNLTAPTEAGRLEQLHRYLFQMTEQLNWALNTIEKDMSNTNTVIQQIDRGGSDDTPEKAQQNFASIKALIIKSADIVESYYETISKKLEGEYSALSEFGTFKQNVTAYFDVSPTEFKQTFNNIQTIQGKVDELENFKEETIEANAYIKTGLLEEDVNGSIYGLEVGQEKTNNGEKVFEKFARFTSDRLSFYNTNGAEVAYISDFKLFITSAEILGSLFHGGYEIDSSDGLAYLWRGRR